MYKFGVFDEHLTDATPTGQSFDRRPNGFEHVRLVLRGIATAISLAVGLESPVFCYVTKRNREFRPSQQTVETGSPQSPGVTWVYRQAMLIGRWQQPRFRETVSDCVHALSFAADNAPQASVLPAQLVCGRSLLVGFRHIEGSDPEIEQFLALIRNLD
jgi:hypothetical protein